MGQKIHPLGFRIGIRERWRSRWNVSKRDIPQTLKEDHEIRRFFKRFYLYAGIPKVEIERAGEIITVFIHTARPGVLIGRKGKKLEEIQADLERIIKDKENKVRLQIVEVNRPELDGQLVSESIREQLEKRQAFRRVIKKAVQTTMNAGAKGVKIRLAGRLGGGEMSRTEQTSEGSIPLSTLDANISYGFTEAVMTTGRIGCKVWIYRGKYGEAPAPAQEPRMRRGPRRY